MRKKHYFIILLFQLISLPLFSQYTVIGGVGDPYPYTPIPASHITQLYFLNGLTNAQITYSSSSAVVVFYKYQTSFANKVQVQASDITTSISGGVTTYQLHNLQDGWGYLAEDNGLFIDAVWIVDYSLHLPQLNSLTTVEGSDKCQNLGLLLNKSDDLFYYGENGLKNAVQRTYTLQYNTMAWDETNKSFSTTPVNEVSSYGSDIAIVAPYADTQFTLKGDQIADHFGLTRSVTSTPYTAVATQAHIEALQNDTTTTLGGSAPIDIAFGGHGNEPVANYYTWSIYKTTDLTNPIVRYTDQNIKYTFTDAGNYKVVLEVADRSSVCSDTTSVSFNVSVSSMDIPNYFSPGAGRQWHISYKSLLKYSCTIFNRWGNKIYEYTDPAGGWDGKYHGSYVNTGVYFYVIQAQGSDGIVYKKGGDINVLRTR